MRYMVHATEGPKFASSQEMLNALETMVLPSLDALADLEANGTIVGGGIPVGDRAVAFVIEAESNDHQQLDQREPACSFHLANLPATERASPAASVPKK